MVALVKTLELILALSFLIFIHELGHFFWAKLFKIRVEKFYLFFDIGDKRIARWKWGETEFGIGWLPLGGYCKISGMIDESVDLEQMKRDPQDWEFRTHPAWQRLLVMFGGVLNNFLFAIAAFCVILGIWGSSYLPNTPDARIYTNELGMEMGFRTGDHIQRMDDYEPQHFEMLQADLVRRDVQKVTVLRGCDTVDLYIDQNYIGDVLNSPGMFDLAIPFVVDSVREGVNAAVLARGDRIVALDSISIEYLQDGREVLARNAGKTISATIIRGRDTLDRSIAVDSLGLMGIYARMPKVEIQEYTALTAIPAGFRMTFKTIGGYLQDLRLLATPQSGAYKSVGSFIAIGQVMPSNWDWYSFMNILALLSIMLAVMNLLPIPGLDGGHILFTLYEMITGRKPSDKFLTIAQLIGMALLIMLMLLAFGNDIGILIH